MILNWEDGFKLGSYQVNWKHFRLYTWKHPTKDSWRGDIAITNKHNVVSSVPYEHEAPFPTTLEESQEILEKELERYLYDRWTEAESLCTQFGALERKTWENEPT